MRIYNPAIGRFLSVDPLAKEYSYKSPYDFAENDVIRNIDLDGEEKLNKVLVESVYIVSNGKVSKNRRPVFEVRTPNDYDVELAKILVAAHNLPTTGYGNMHYYESGGYLDYFVDGKGYRIDVNETLDQSKKNKEFASKVYGYYNQILGIVTFVALDYTLGKVFNGGSATKSSEKMLDNKTIFIDENLYSIELQTALAEEGFATMAIKKGTKDPAIIAKLKEMDAIILTNNVKDFLKQDVPIIKVSEKLKSQTSKIVSQMKKLSENVKEGKTDLKAKNGVSLVNE